MAPSRCLFPSCLQRIRLHQCIWCVPSCVRRKYGPVTLFHLIRWFVSNLSTLLRRHAVRKSSRRGVLPFFVAIWMRNASRRHIRHRVGNKVLAAVPCSRDIAGHRQWNALHPPRLAGVDILYQEKRLGPWFGFLWRSSGRHRISSGKLNLTWCL